MERRIDLDAELVSRAARVLGTEGEGDLATVQAALELVVRRRAEQIVSMIAVLGSADWATEPAWR